MIYLDHNATTPLSPAAWRAMQPYFERHHGNPSSMHQAGRETRAAIDDARDRLATLLRVKSHELIFTSGGTESNNLAVLGLARAQEKKGRHLICSRAEHHAVLHAFEHLEKREGFEVTWLDVSRDGLIEPEQVECALRPDTTLVSLMRANNETGVVQPLHEIGALCRARGVLLHSDIVQSFGKLETDLAGDNVDAASFAAHKFYGPKGAGLLYLRAGLSIDAIQFGGAHESQRRPGTENAPAIVGMAIAASETLADRATEQSRQKILRDRLWRGIAAAAPAAQLNGDVERRLANTLNVSFPGCTSEMLLMSLDLEGVGVSSGSACMVGSVVASHVLLAMGWPPERAGSALRFSLGKATTTEEIEQTIRTIENILRRSRGVEKQEAHALSAAH
jgi:cysteine desulfurase